jgi:hypothetical protein
MWPVRHNRIRGGKDGMSSSVVVAAAGAGGRLSASNDMG